MRRPLFRRTFRGLCDEVIRRGWGSVSFTPVVNTEDADEIRWFEVEKDPPLADPQAQLTGTVLEGLHVAWPVAAKRTGAASIRAWTTRSRRARSRTAAGRKTTRRITARAGVGLPAGGHRRPVPYGPDPAWPRSRHR